MNMTRRMSRYMTGREIEDLFRQLDEVTGSPGEADTFFVYRKNSKTVKQVSYLDILAGTTNDIGAPGKAGFGVGVCPYDSLPDGMDAIVGTTLKGHENYGNYQFSDGSIMVYVPAHYVKIGTGANGLDTNVIDVKKISYFTDEAAANTDGYFLPRCFKDGGEAKQGIFVDKYMASKNAMGTGFVASSVKNGNPISTNSAHNPISELTACDSDNYYQAITAAHARDGVDGTINTGSIFFCKSRFVTSMLMVLAIAHGQAASYASCAWHDPAGNTNYPKGCNNDALGDTDDGNISYQSDGYDNCGKTGSGEPFAKTTHNGQDCGIADLNGLMWEIDIGVTCIATDHSVEDITRANPASVQITAHGFTTGDYLMLRGIEAGDWANLDDKIYKITVVDADNFTLDGVDTSGFAAAYDQATNGGTFTYGTFYVAKESVAMSDFTAGDSGATDHWGGTGIANMMTEFDMVFKTGYPDNGFIQDLGSGSNQVLSEATDGNGAVLTSLGLPKDADGVSDSGTNLFGRDRVYQYIRDDLCVLSAGGWHYYSDAGVGASSWNNSRTYSSSSVGFRCACYPV